MATFWLPRKLLESSKYTAVDFSFPVRLFFQFFFSVHCLMVFRSKGKESLIPSLASQESEKHSSLMSFVVECRFLVSNILVSEQPAVKVCVFTKNR